MTTADVRDFPRSSVPEAQHRAASGARGVKAPSMSVFTGPSNAFGTIRNVFQTYAPLAYFLPWEILDYVEILATYNPDYSQAVDNVMTLANSGHELFVQADSDLQTRRVKQYLEDVAQTIQESFGGIDGLIDKLLHQATVYGAMCGEWILDEDLKEVVDFADINPKYVRFFWDYTAQKYMPFQKLVGSQLQEAADRGQRVVAGCAELNPVTFHYYGFNAAPNSPYGTPPFVAALEPIGIQKDMIANMSQIVKKIGLLGIVDLVVQQLPQKPGESVDDYTARATAYLDSYVTAAEDMVRDGGLVHFDDVELKTTNIAGNAAGATNIFKQNEELVFSGLKSMPSVQGRSYSTTETYAGVAYDIIIRNTKRYQRSVKRMIERGYTLAAGLGGYTPKVIAIQFHENKSLHRLQEAQAEAIEIKNKAKLWKAGVINQIGFAQEMGYSDIDKPLDEVPPEVVTDHSAETINDSLDPTGGGKPDNSNNAQSAN